MRKKLITLMIISIFLASSLLIVQADNTRALAVRGKPAGAGKPHGGGGSSSGGTAITGNRYALVIGISDYQGTSNDLQYADDDAKDWANYLRGVGYQVDLLLDSQATKANILAAFQALADKEQAGDGVVIAYSGHGYYSKRDKTSMLIAWELVGVTTAEIEAITDTFDTQHVYFFDDACNQGTMDKLGNPGWLLAIGSNTHTYTYDGDATMANGIFTYYMMEALYMPTYVIEDASNYAISHFEADTPGDATLYDYFTGDFYF